MSASNPRTRLMRMRQDVLREMIDGESYSKLAYKYKTSKPLLMSVMREYRAYKHWLLARKQDSMLMDQEIRQYLDNGMTVANLAELYWVSYDTMRTRVNEIEKTTKNEYLGPVDRAETKRYVTVDDVKEFNSDLEDAQHWANSYWTNWMNEQACNEFETFDIPEYKRSKE